MFVFGYGRFRKFIAFLQKGFLCPRLPGWCNCLYTAVNLGPLGPSPFLEFAIPTLDQVD